MPLLQKDQAHMYLEGKYMCFFYDQLKPNEEFKTYYGEQPHKMINNPNLSFKYTFFKLD